MIMVCFRLCRRWSVFDFCWGDKAHMCVFIYGWVDSMNEGFIGGVNNLVYVVPKAVLDV